MSKIHLTPSMVAALHFLDEHHEDLSSTSQDLAENLLNVMDSYPLPFLQNVNDIKPNTPNNHLLPPLPSDECGGFLTFDQVKTLSSLLIELKYSRDQCALHHLLQNGTICCHSEYRSTYSPEFAARLLFLRTKHARETLEMELSNLPSSKAKAQASERGFMSKNLQQIGAPINFVAVAGTCSFVAYFIGGTLFPHNKGLQWTFAIIGLLFGFIVETFLFVLRDYHQSNAEQFHKRQGDRKDQASILQIRSSLMPRKPITFSRTSENSTVNPTITTTALSTTTNITPTDDGKSKYIHETKKQR